jgi:hypothetical protein
LAACRKWGTFAQNCFALRLPGILILLILILIQVLLLAACTDSGGTSRQGNPFGYAEIQGDMHINNKNYTIRRKLFVAKSGFSKVVLSTITDDNINAGKAERMIEDYLLNDSVFIYDSADSSLLALSCDELALMDIATFPFSGSWLLKKTAGLRTVEASRCPEIEGYSTTTFRHGIYELCFLNGQAIGLNGNKKKLIHKEYHSRIVADTLLNEDIFMQPTGFKRIEPS